MAPAGQSPLLGSIASLIIPQAAGLEANLKRGREIEREQELDGGQLPCTPSWYLSLSFCK